jgi:hypothetical protein
MISRGVSHRPRAAAAAGSDARARGAAGGSFHSELRGVAEHPDAQKHAFGISAPFADGGAHLGRGVGDPTDCAEPVADSEALGRALDDQLVAHLYVGACSELSGHGARSLRHGEVEQCRRLQPVEAAVPTLAPGLAGLRADVVETHQAISRSGLNDFVFPRLRSTSRPFVASADSRLFQAVGPICWSAKRAASSGAVMAPSSSAASNVER